MTETNGSAGRFERMESKLDRLIDKVGGLDVKVARIERTLELQDEATEDRKEDRQSNWARAGILGAWMVGLGGIVVGIFHH